MKYIMLPPKAMLSAPRGNDTRYAVQYSGLCSVPPFRSFKNLSPRETHFLLFNIVMMAYFIQIGMLLFLENETLLHRFLLKF